MALPPKDSSVAFWQFWSASTVSAVGSGISTVAIPLIALTMLDASNFEVGLITAAGYAATVLIGLPAGVIVGRFSLRAVQVGMDSFRLLMVLTIPLAAWWGILTIAQLVVVSLLVGLATNLFAVANMSFLPGVVPKEQLTSRNGLFSGSQAATQLVGPSLGGVLVQAMGAAALILDAVSYAISAVLLGRVDAAGHPPRPPRRGPMFAQMVEGMRFVWRHPVMRPCLLTASAVNLAFGALLAASPPFLLRTLGLPESVVGLVMAVETVGSLTAAALTARFTRRFGTARGLLMATLFGGVTALLIPLAAGPAAVALFGAGVIGMAAGVTTLSVLTRTHRQQESPPEMLTRVMASVRFVSWGVIPVGSLLAGLLAEAWEPRAGLALVAAGALLAPVFLFLSPVRQLRDLEDAVVTSPL